MIPRDPVIGAALEYWRSVPRREQTWARRRGLVEHWSAQYGLTHEATRAALDEAREAAQHLYPDLNCQDDTFSIS